MISACLVTPTPDFQAPTRTAPYLVAESAVPALPQILVVDANVKSVDFQALVRSEDAGTAVQVRLLVDYGNPFGNCPCQGYAQGNPVAASTLDDPNPRTAKVTWFNPMNGSGCHTFTLMVSHEFDAQNCPIDSADASSLTWFAYICAAGETCTPNLATMDNCMPQSPKFCPRTDAATTSSTGGAQ
jgi:hypothetical protein